MADDVFEREEQVEMSEARFCPLLREPCRQDNCQWWSVDFMEDRGTHRMDCAIVLIAKGINDESLARLQGGGIGKI